MAKGPGTLRRFIALLEIVEQHPGIRKGSLIQRLADDYDIETSARTTERDFNDLHADYGLSIRYNRKDKGYHLEKDQGDNLETLLFLLNKEKELETLSELRNAAKKGEVYIHMEPSYAKPADALIHQLLTAIANRQQISINYQKFNSPFVNTHTVDPHLLRQRNGRWYLLAWNHSVDTWGTFGLERIVSISPLKKKFKRKESSLLEAKMATGIGIHSGDAELIRLRFDNTASPYIKTLPLHTTQEVESEDAEGIEISLYVAITPELLSQVLSFGDGVYVLAPDSLRSLVVDTLKRSLSQYE